MIRAEQVAVLRAQLAEAERTDPVKASQLRALLARFEPRPSTRQIETR